VKIMPRYIVDLWLDGYETEEEVEEACDEFLYEQLNMTASGVTFRKINDSDTDIDILADRINGV